MSQRWSSLQDRPTVTPSLGTPSLGTSLGWIGPSNQLYGQSASESWWASPALLDKWAQIRVQRLQCHVASMPRRLAAIIAARGGNTRYWPGTHKTRPPGSVTKKRSYLFDQIYHNYLPVTFRYAHSANYSFYHQMSSKLTKHNRIKNRASNT